MSSSFLYDLCDYFEDINVSTGISLSILVYISTYCHIGREQLGTDKERFHDPVHLNFYHLGINV
ncbi:unnamed protein product [Schistosoma margrebowiei]|uniref:Uncharacterized protein n=1 Tax=Schistosoma margrebowiei TaxID=48269 RepID=A0A183N6N9_9TREM|nr:unnamed protein product [Schistosoma margrebowiei]